MIETNHNKIHRSIKKKGWDKQYISKTISILKKKHPHHKKQNILLFWFSVLLMIFTSTIVFVGVMPVIIKTPFWLTYFVILILGLCIGWFMDHVLRHIEMTHKHYVFTGLFIPVCLGIILFIILEFVKSIVKDIGIFISINPLLLLMLYIIGYSIPHLMYLLNELK